MRRTRPCSDAASNAASTAAASVCRRRHGAGFTLIELILVLVMTATLAVFALPKLVEVGFWRSHAFASDMIAQVEAMQRQALVQQRTVRVDFAATGLTFVDLSNGSITIGTLPCPTGPCIGAGAGTSITFNSLVNGQRSGRSSTSSGSALTITVGSGGDALNYRVENETGLIYKVP